MNEDYEAWPSAEPPDGFAERTARAILTRAPRERRWRKPVGLFLAAALLAGGAWATARLALPAARVSPIERETPPLPMARPVPVHVVTPPVPSAEVAQPKPPAKARPAAAPSQEPAAPPNRLALPPPPPSCDCGPGANICTCRGETSTERQTP